MKLKLLSLFVFVGTFSTMAQENVTYQKPSAEILASEGYTTKAACLNGVESVKKNSQDEARFDKLESKNGKFYFNLKATNGQIIGTSEMYESTASRDNGIASVAKNAPDASVDDQTA